MTMEERDARVVRWFRACRRGDDRSARLLYAHLAPVLTRYARTILRDGGLAEDAVQGAFCRVLRTPMGEIRRVRDPRAWMVMVVRREALMMVRARRREGARVERIAAARKDEREGGRDDEVSRAVDGLARRLREVVVLRHVAGMTYGQIAEAIGVNANTVAARHRRAMAILGERLGAEREVAHAGR